MTAKCLWCGSQQYYHSSGGFGKTSLQSVYQGSIPLLSHIKDFKNGIYSSHTWRSVPKGQQKKSDYCTCYLLEKVAKGVSSYLCVTDR